DEDRIYDPVLVERAGRYVGLVQVHTLLSATTELEIEHARYASPLTGLPGNVIIEHEMLAALDAARRGTPAAIVHADLDNFKSYNDVYGFAAGDAVIRLVAELLGQVFASCSEDLFLGHIGGDDFVVILPAKQDVEAACAEVARRFDERVPAYYS